MLEPQEPQVKVTVAVTVLLEADQQTIKAVAVDQVVLDKLDKSTLLAVAEGLELHQLSLDHQ
jgi:hypothetical protein